MAQRLQGSGARCRPRRWTWHAPAVPPPAATIGPIAEGTERAGCDLGLLRTTAAIEPPYRRNRQLGDVGMVSLDRRAGLHPTGAGESRHRGQGRRGHSCWRGDALDDQPRGQRQLEHGHRQPRDHSAACELARVRRQVGDLRMPYRTARRPGCRSTPDRPRRCQGPARLATGLCRLWPAGSRKDQAQFVGPEPPTLLTIMVAR